MISVSEEERLFGANYLFLNHYHKQSMGGVLLLLPKFLLLLT